MSFYIAIGVIVLWFFLVGLARELHMEASHRRDDRIMAAWEREESARAHRYRLAEIEARRQATAEEMIRVAADASGKIIEGSAVEEHRS
jgi:hypothetical protein